MRRIVRHLLTGKDNETHDIARWYLAGGFMLLTVVAIPVLIMTGGTAALIEPLGLALGALATGTGVLMKAKERQEPNGEGGNPPD